MSAAEARNYRDALMLWPSPHCALEYQRMFVRNQVRPTGWEFRRALRRPVDVSLPGVGHLPTRRPRTR